jgi:hypothetical protein
MHDYSFLIFDAKPKLSRDYAAKYSMRISTKLLSLKAQVSAESLGDPAYA